MTHADLLKLIEGQAPGGLIPRDWLLDLLRDVDAGEGDSLADLSAEEAGKLLHRSPSTVRDYARRGLLDGAYRQQGCEWRIPRTAITAFGRAQSAPKPTTPRRRGQEVDLGAWRKELDEDAA